MTVTNDYDFELDGYALHGLTEVTGLDMPDVDMNIVSRWGAHGSWTSGRYLKERVFSLTGRIASNATDVITDEANLKAAFLPTASDISLVFKLPGMPVQRSYVKSQGVKYTTRNVETAVGLVDFVGLLVAADPRIYAYTMTGPVAFNAGDTSLGGLAFPASFPLVFGSTTTGTAATLTNDGNWTAPVTIRFNGPLTNPSITNSTTSQTLRLQVALSSGEYIEVKTLDRTVLLDTGASRYSTVTPGSAFPELSPGDNVFSASSDGGSGSITVSWYNTWV